MTEGDWFKKLSASGGVALAEQDAQPLAAAELGRVLVVDDDRPFGGFMLAALSSRGHQAEWVGSVADALDALYTQRYDVVIIDFRLPDGSGLQLLRRATDEGLLSGSAAIILTGQSFDEPSDIRVFHKPFDVDQFLDRIGAMVAVARRRGGRPGRQPSPATPAAADNHGRRRSAPDPRVDLVLYVSAASENSRRALAAVRAVLERFDGSQVRFSVRDLAADPALGDDDSVIFTPTLVKRGPGPRTWVVGNLEHDEVLIDLLDGSGVDRRRDGRG